MRMIRPEQLKHLRETYPAGTRIELIQMDDAQAPPTGTCGTVIGVDDTGSLLVNWVIQMDDAQAPPTGTCGTVIGVDDTGSLLVNWDNGSGLNVIWGVDVVRKVVAGND